MRKIRSIKRNGARANPSKQATAQKVAIQQVTVSYRRPFTPSLVRAVNEMFRRGLRLN